MIKRYGTFSLALLAGSLALSGCATTGSVKRAQARADEAYGEAQNGNTAAQRAQGSADAAMGAAQRAQGSADQAGAAAQGAGNSAQAASATAMSANEQIARLSSRLHKLEAANRRSKTRHKSRHHTHKPKTAKAAPESTPAQFR